MKTLEDEQYVVIKAYKFTIFEIWRDFNVLSYIACPRYPYIRVYRLNDTYLECDTMHTHCMLLIRFQTTCRFLDSLECRVAPLCT